MDYLRPGNWPGMRFRELTKSRNTNMNTVLSKNFSDLVEGNGVYAL